MYPYPLQCKVFPPDLPGLGLSLLPCTVRPRCSPTPLHCQAQVYPYPLHCKTLVYPYPHCTARPRCTPTPLQWQVTTAPLFLCCMMAWSVSRGGYYEHKHLRPRPCVKTVECPGEVTKCFVLSLFNIFRCDSLLLIYQDDI